MKESLNFTISAVPMSGPAGLYGQWSNGSRFYCPMPYEILSPDYCPFHVKVWEVARRTVEMP